MDVIAPLSGWLLDHIVWLDKVRPGFAGRILRVSPERRQHVAAYLAAIPVSEETSREVAEFLERADHGSILRSAFTRAPAGLRQALRKSGPSPHGKIYYQRLHDLLSSGDARIVATIQCSERLNPDRLSIIEALPGRLCDIRIVCRIATSNDAVDLALVADLLEQRGVDRGAFIEALCRSSLSIGELVQRWSLKLSFPAGPIVASDVYRPLRDGPTLEHLARKYRNCLRSFLPSLIEGNQAFGEYTHEGRDVLISFERTQGYWRANGVHTYLNGEVHLEVARAAFAFAAAHGVSSRRLRERGDKAMDALRRLSRSAFQ